MTRSRPRPAAGDDPVVLAEAPGATPPFDPDAALDALVAGFGLSPFEREVLVQAVARQLAPEAGPLTVGDAVAVLPGGELAAFGPDRPLRAARLVTVPAGVPLAAAPVVAEARVVLHLHGDPSLDERLAPYLTPVTPSPVALPASRRQAAQQLGRGWDSALGAKATRWGDQPVPMVVHGPGPRDLHDVVAEAATARHLVLWRAAATDLPVAAAERDALVRLWNREAVLAPVALLVDTGDEDDPALLTRVSGVLGRLIGPVAVAAPSPAGLDGAAGLLPLARPSREEQAALWAAVLPGRRRAATDLADQLSRRYDLDHADITGGPVDLRTGDDDAAVLADRRSRGRVRSRLDGGAQRIEPRATWDDLVLAPAQLRQLRHLAAAAAGRTLLEDRGFGHETERGHGVTALLAGPSGTGKTLAAEVLAGELGLDLYRIDLSTTVSKWIGETEKNLRRLFDAAEQGGVVLLFDEADALFGQRTEVRDSHDRYANLEVSYLLQRMEQYRGLALLTTNLRSAIDPAFLRRLRMVVTFTHPTEAERARLWATAFPAGVATGALDRGRLVRLDLTGGQIRTIAQQATLAALGEGAPVSMDHLRDAVAAEYAKHDRSLAELDGWA